MNNLKLIILPLLLAVTACVQEVPTIETFQLMENSWDQSLYNEFQREAAFHEGVDFKFNIATSAQDEADQIERAIDRGVDAIVVNPYTEKELLPVIEKAYDAGLFVILVGQKLPTFKYTSYVGPDNRLLGVEAAEYIEKRLPNGGNIIEIEAYRDAPYYKDRHEMFRHMIDSYQEIHTVGRFDAAWDAEKAHHGMDSLKAVLGKTKVDLIFGYGDEVIRGAVESMNYPDAIYVGTEGVPGYAVQAIINGAIDATFSSPTGGTQAISTAVSILNGQSFVKDNILQPKLVDKNNAALILADNNEIADGHHKIDILNSSLKASENNIHKLRIHILAESLIVLFLLLCTLNLLYQVSRSRKAEDAMIEKTREMEKEVNELLFQKEVAERLKWQLESERDALLEASAARQVPEPPKDAIEEAIFMKKFRDSIERHLDNAELSVEDIAAELGVSRAQLYRRIKAESGATPNDLLQAMRLDKAEQMLKSTQMTVSEIAYAVGFSSPSYFSKCYKDKFGIAPSDLRG